MVKRQKTAQVPPISTPKSPGKPLRTNARFSDRIDSIQIVLKRNGAAGSVCSKAKPASGSARILPSRTRNSWSYDVSAG